MTLFGLVLLTFLAAPAPVTCSAKPTPKADGWIQVDGGGVPPEGCRPGTCEWEGQCYATKNLPDNAGIWIKYNAGTWSFPYADCKAKAVSGGWTQIDCSTPNMKYRTQVKLHDFKKLATEVKR